LFRGVDISTTKLAAEVVRGSGIGRLFEVERDEEKKEVMGTHAFLFLSFFFFFLANWY